MDLKSKIQPIVLIYEERDWTQQTTACLRAAGLDNIHYVDRDGVGSMAKAFNRGARQVLSKRKPPKYLWFVTNVTFPAALPGAMLEKMEETTTAAAIHPAFDSDHPHIRKPDGEWIPFIEWTAPLVRVDAWQDVGELDEAMPYVHFDLDWSQRAKQAGWVLMATDAARMGHTYLWKDAPEPISHLRRQLRAIRHESSVARMVEKWGPDWRTKLCPTGTCG